MSDKPPPSPSVNEAETLMRKARSRGHGRRSPIMSWMQQNRQELEAAFARTAPAWSVLATYLGEHGITDGDGKPPTARATRGAWGRVKALPVPLAAPVPATSASVTTPPLSVPPVPQDDLGPPRPPRFTTATLRNHMPAAAPPEPPPPMPTVPRQDPDAVIAGLLGRGTRPSGFRKPEPKDE